MSIEHGYVVAIVASLVGTVTALSMARMLHVFVRSGFAKTRAMRWLINFWILLLLLLALLSTWMTFEEGSRLYDRLHQQPIGTSTLYK